MRFEVQNEEMPQHCKRLQLHRSSSAMSSNLLQICICFFESAMYSRIAAFTLKQPPVVEIVGMSVYKRPATSVGRLMQRPASKKNAKVNTPAQLPLLKTVLNLPWTFW